MLKYLCLNASFTLPSFWILVHLRIATQLISDFIWVNLSLNGPTQAKSLFSYFGDIKSAIAFTRKKILLSKCHTYTSSVTSYKLHNLLLKFNSLTFAESFWVQSGVFIPTDAVLFSWWQNSNSCINDATFVNGRAPHRSCRRKGEFQLHNHSNSTVAARFAYCLKVVGSIFEANP